MCRCVTARGGDLSRAAGAWRDQLKMRRTVGLLAVVGCSLAGTWWPATHVAAATKVFVVNSTGDASDAAANGVCATSTGTCTFARRADRGRSGDGCAGGDQLRDPGDRGAPHRPVAAVAARRQRDGGDHDRRVQPAGQLAEHRPARRQRAAHDRAGRQGSQRDRGAGRARVAQRDPRPGDAPLQAGDPVQRQAGDGEPGHRQHDRPRPGRHAGLDVRDHRRLTVHRHQQRRRAEPDRDARRRQPQRDLRLLREGRHALQRVHLQELDPEQPDRPRPDRPRQSRQRVDGRRHQLERGTRPWSVAPGSRSAT